MPDIDAILDRIVAQLRGQPGVVAIALGGSRARGTHTAPSDIDIGIYYDPARPLALDHLNQAATALDDQHRDQLLTPVGGWGPWINGGGWLMVDGIAVDFLYRDLARVQQVAADCRRGMFEFAYQPGHPHGFASYIYLGELAVCRPCWDPGGVLDALKAQTDPYPPPLQTAIIARFWWEAAFALQTARKSVGRADVAYLAGCGFRSVACLLQTLFAVNRQYWLNEKGAVALAARFAHTPAHLAERITQAFALLAGEGAAMQEGIHILNDLCAETDILLQQHAGD